MKIGDLYLFNSTDRKSFFIVSKFDANINPNIGTIVQFTNSRGDVIDPKPIGVSLYPGDAHFIPVAWSSPEYLAVMAGKSVPAWVSQICAAAQQTQPQPAQGPLNLTQTTYPIGSILLGTGKAGNVWIVNKQWSRDISLLWDGRQARWCGSELEHTDRLATSPQRVDTFDLIDFINQQKPPVKQTVSSVPQWAMKLMVIAPQTAPTAPPPVTHTIISPQAVAVMAKAGIIDPMSLFKKDEPKKKVDSHRDACDHEYRQYIGFTHVFEYCAKCDKKR